MPAAPPENSYAENRSSSARALRAVEDWVAALPGEDSDRDDARALLNMGKAIVFGIYDLTDAIDQLNNTQRELVREVAAGLRPTQ